MEPKIDRVQMNGVSGPVRSPRKRREEDPPFELERDAAPEPEHETDSNDASTLELPVSGREEGEAGGQIDITA